MKIKKFVAPTIKQALTDIKRELGDEAVILNSRQVQKSGLRDVFSKEMYEVTAALDEFDQPIAKKRQTISRDTYVPDEKVIKPKPVQNETANTNQWKSVDSFSKISSEMKELKLSMKQLAEKVDGNKGNFSSPEITKMYLSLMDAGVNDRIANDLIDQLNYDTNDAEINDPLSFLKGKLAEKITTRPIRHSNNQRPLIIALIGPTGVGKTTTIAKMATNPRIYGKDRVAFISTDTYRIAAIEQLRTFAKIARIPLEVTYSVDEIQQAIIKHRNKEVIFIDTPGRSPNNQQHMVEMNDVIKKAKPDETHLVLSVTTKYEDIIDTIRKYDVMNVNRLLFTKFDETSCPGSIMNIVHRFKTPLSFITNGQEVPDDIRAVEKSEIINLILK